ncbi:hypothetical protein [Sphingomonas sp. Leaf343]|uniref:hypothetical protein n=1 Tax=Sphingomonas sp. Leaf343 TaxID=1736345 RepID=UPI0006FEF41D|nr:hypothetical protein [Sphingomonas sp. Leaf343]KQR87375.1 hypothetical protein ASG07_00045 [Sphingomonas sp. Leaf343]
MTSGSSEAWDGDRVRTWLERRLTAARLDQAAADRQGYAARDDYDKAAAEEWVYRALQAGGHADGQSAFAGHVKALLDQDVYRATGVHDDLRFERHVRGVLRKLAKMTKTNDGFGNTLRYQG